VWRCGRLVDRGVDLLAISGTPRIADDHELEKGLLAPSSTGGDAPP